VVRRVARECPPEKRPTLLRRVADLDGGEGLAAELLLAVIESDPGHVAPLLEAYRARFPISPMLNAWTIEARLGQGRFDEALRLHREALADLGTRDPRIFKVLLDAMEHDDPAIRLASLNALRKITSKDLGTDVAAWRREMEPMIAAMPADLVPPASVTAAADEAAAGSAAARTTIAR
ncbi:hypothetical protein HK102_011016, partial [Quaeritorhiza haematococci]